MTATDAGPLIAIIDRDDADHQLCLDALPRLSAPLLTTWAAFTEAMHLLGTRAGWSAQESLWALCLRGDLRLAAIDGEALERTSELMRKYRDVPMDLADATLVALAEKLKLRRIFTLDRDFRIYRIHGSRPFQMVP